MIDLIHMILDVFVEKKATYVIDFLKMSDDFAIGNPEDFRIEWSLNNKGALFLQLTFTDVRLYEYLADYSSNKKEMGKWSNRINVALNKQNNVSKWRLKGCKVLEENNQKRIQIVFCQW